MYLRYILQFPLSKHTSRRERSDGCSILLLQLYGNKLTKRHFLLCTAARVPAPIVGFPHQTIMAILAQQGYSLSHVLVPRDNNHPDDLSSHDGYVLESAPLKRKDSFADLHSLNVRCHCSLCSLVFLSAHIPTKRNKENMGVVRKTSTQKAHSQRSRSVHCRKEGPCPRVRFL